MLQTGYLFSRVILTLIIYLAVLALLRPRISRLSVLLLSALTIFELGYNAYLSQVTLGYADVDKFVDATVSVKRVTDSVQENADQPSTALLVHLLIHEQHHPLSGTQD